MLTKARSGVFVLDPTRPGPRGQGKSCLQNISFLIFLRRVKKNKFNQISFLQQFVSSDWHQLGTSPAGPCLGEGHPFPISHHSHPWLGAGGGGQWGRSVRGNFSPESHISLAN